MRSKGPLANKKVARWPGGLVASWPGHSSRLAESGRLVRRMSHHVDPAANAEEARTVRLDAVLGPPRRSVPVGDSSTPESRTLTPLIMVRIQVPQPGSRPLSKSSYQLPVGYLSIARGSTNPGKAPTRSTPSSTAILQLAASVF